MPTKSEEFLAVEAEEQARLDLWVGSQGQDAAEEIDELLHNPGARDEEIFELVGADQDETIDDYADVPVDERDFTWVAGLSAMVVGARLQRWSGQRGDIGRLFGSRVERLAAIKIPRRQLISAAKFGVSKNAILEAKKHLGKNFLPPLSRRTVFDQLIGADLLSALSDARIIPSFGLIQNQAAPMAVRMMQIPPDSVAWLGAKADLVASESQLRQLELTRSAAQQHSTVIDTAGDTSVEMIWVVEGDENTCDNCAPRAAEIRTYDEWMSIGMPGASVCKGGDRCRCDLYPIDQEIGSNLDEYVSDPETFISEAAIGENE